MPSYEQTGNYSVTFQAEANGLSDSESITISVGDVNRPPEASDISLTTKEDNAISIDLDGNSNDPDEEDELSISNLTEVSNGQLVDNGDGTVTYTPDENWNGENSFSYTVTDGELKATAEVTVTVNAVNDSPVASADSAKTDEFDS